MAVIDGQLTTIGGREAVHYKISNTNVLLSLQRKDWMKIFPPMPTGRLFPAVVTANSRLMVAGGCGSSKVEVLDLQTLQWSEIASSIPQSAQPPWLTFCDHRFYLYQDTNVYSCSAEDLFKRPSALTRFAEFFTDSSDSSSMWTKLAANPARFGTSLAVVGERVLSIGGIDSLIPTTTIHCYNSATNSWSEYGQLPTPVSNALSAVLSDKTVIVVKDCRVYIRHGHWLD